jgi:hypothetical protein
MDPSKLPKLAQIHPTINISRVQLYFGPKPDVIPLPPRDDTDREYPVERILAKEIRDGEEFYLIHWKGYPAEDDSWEPRDNLAPETLKLWDSGTSARSRPRNPPKLRAQTRRSVFDLRHTQ